MVVLRVCMCVGGDVTGAISMAFTMSAVKIEVKAFWPLRNADFSRSYS